MATSLIKMGEEKGRKTPVVVVNVRDNLVELIQKEIIEKMELVTTNQVNDKDAIEGLCGEVVRSAGLALRCLEFVGAQTRPDYELEKVVHGRRVYA